MWNYLESLRTRSDEYKRRFAYVVSGVVTVFIFCVWVWATFFRAPHQVQNTQASQSQEASAIGAGMTSTASTTSSWQEIEDVVGRLKKTFNAGVSQFSVEQASTSTTTQPKQDVQESDRGRSTAQ